MQTKWKHLTIIALCFFFYGLTFVPFGNATQLRRVRHHTHSDKTRVVFDLSTATRYTIAEIDAKILALHLVNCTSQKQYWRIDDDRVNIVRISNTLEGIEAQVALKEPVSYKIFTLETPSRIVLDLFTSNNSTAAVDPHLSQIPLDSTVLLQRAAEERQEIPHSRRKVRRIVLDAGHGGFDSGATNAKMGLYEKDLALRITLALKKVIEEREKGDIQVFLTRTGDYYVTLSDRVVTANQYQANLFISIHCNAHSDPRANGFEVYFSSQEASDREAAAVAARENALGLTDSFFQEDNSIDIESILKNLLRRRNLTESQRYAVALHRSVRDLDTIDTRPVKRADFAVLRFAEMPAILIEVGFLTNTGDAKRLKSKHFHRQIAQHIYDGIRAQMTR